MEKILFERDRALKILSGKIEGFYLAGGTALSLFYFHHRESYDLDFFTKEFLRPNVEKIVSELSKSTGRKIELYKVGGGKDKAQVLIYYLLIDKDNALKIDFVEDVYGLLKPTKIIDGIPVLSIEDIYIRKIFAACGTRQTEDLTGKKAFLGGRQEARDFFDLYFLSTTFMPLSKFAFEHFNEPDRERIVVWYRTYDRMCLIDGVLEIRTDKKVDYRKMENHFKEEIEQIIKKELE